VITPLEFRNQLEERGLVILDVAAQRSHPSVFVVYLHGNAGQWVDGLALKMISEVPGVASVKEAERTPTILVVEMRIEAGKGERP
jgi:hypothetical protein